MIKENLTKINFSRGRNAPISFIVVHYTANNGDTDEGNANYFKSTYRKASAHYFVDDDSVTRVVKDTDTAWHCNDNQKYTNGGATHKKLCNNSNSIGIEMCSDIVNGEYVITEQTQVNTIKLIEELMATHNIKIENVIRHYDVSGKLCPKPFVATAKWNKFKSRIGEEDMIKRYNKVSELPKGLQKETKELINSGALKGDEKGNLDVTEDMVRCMIVNKRYADRK